MIMNWQQKIVHSIARQQHLRFGYSQRYAVASLVVAASVSAALVSTTHLTSERSEKQGISLSYRSAAPQAICACEKNLNTDATPLPLPTSTKRASPPPLSRLTLLLYASKLYPYSYLPTPRLITPRDPLFAYPELKRGLVRRRNDEERVKQILSSPELMEARKNQDQAQMQTILKQMNSVVYGDGITPQAREDFLMQFGCTGFTDETLQYIVQTFGHRGVLEVGAGNGQWARALSDYYNEFVQNQHEKKNFRQSWDFILAYDNMKELPLSPKVYHQNTVPAKKNFYSNVKRASHVDAVQNARGRVLMLVYPPPGPMALETVLAYLNASLRYDGSYKNDTIVYVGEGRGGANADDAFFDYFLGKNVANKDTENSWVLEKVMGVQTCPGGKGYEKMFVFRRKPSC
mmetsp:Transcript_565/g.1198  ORF Transcript_565/g.1198 Transcript_565/m.1198 type:complete len:403 (+) Transcript_565:101-1309(+)